ncbi:hypothetical protein LCGC14_2416850 [marine sediment metagenome]|uniref:Uncharacterized protein n=1 Tax=marine sediment metagenome TaxID=412755 RepID=A0A0F9CD21_9ZZZZ
MKKKEEIEFVKIQTEFKLIKRLVFIIFTILLALLLNMIWNGGVFTIVGNVVKEIPRQGNLTGILTILLIVSVTTGLIIIKRKEKK